MAATHIDLQLSSVDDDDGDGFVTSQMLHILVAVAAVGMSLLRLVSITSKIGIQLTVVTARVFSTQPLDKRRETTTTTTIIIIIIMKYYNNSKRRFESMNITISTVIAQNSYDCNVQY